MSEFIVAFYWALELSSVARIKCFDRSNCLSLLSLNNQIILIRGLICYHSSEPNSGKRGVRQNLQNCAKMTSCKIVQNCAKIAWADCALSNWLICWSRFHLPLSWWPPHVQLLSSSGEKLRGENVLTRGPTFVWLLFHQRWQVAELNSWPCFLTHMWRQQTPIHHICHQHHQRCWCPNFQAGVKKILK